MLTSDVVEDFKGKIIALFIPILCAESSNMERFQGERRLSKHVLASFSESTLRIVQKTNHDNAHVAAHQTSQSKGYTLLVQDDSPRRSQGSQKVTVYKTHNWFDEPLGFLNS